MAKVVGEATANGKKQQKLLEALQDALKKAPPPTGGNDIQHFKLISVELEFGGFVNSTRTRVTLDVKNGPLK
jgi:hypothetical protein